MAVFGIPDVRDWGSDDEAVVVVVTVDVLAVGAGVSVGVATGVGLTDLRTLRRVAFTLNILVFLAVKYLI